MAGSVSTISPGSNPAPGARASNSPPPRSKPAPEDPETPLPPHPDRTEQTGPIQQIKPVETNRSTRLNIITPRAVPREQANAAEEASIFARDPGERPIAASHLDADAFFVAVCQAADTALRGKAVAVGGMRRGIIASASYEARRYGVYTPMPTSRALRVCPHLIVIPGDYERFEQFSRFMFSYVYDFTPEVEICSIDEGYFNLTGNRRVPPVEALETIRNAIRQSLKISVSQGLGTSKIVSQIASKIRKPNGLVVVQPGRERQFLYPLPVSKMPGIGPAVESKLNSAGITRLEQLARMPLDLLRLVLGKPADTFRNYSRGIDPRPIVTSEEPAKSYGHQDTFSSDTVDDDFVEAKLKALIDEAVNRMRRDGKSARTLGVTIRYSDMEETTRGVSLHEPGDLPDDFYGQGVALLKKAWDRRVRLRMIRVKLSNIYNSPPMPDLLTARDRQRRTALQQVLTQVQTRYGPRALMRAHELFLRNRGQG